MMRRLLRVLLALLFVFAVALPASAAPTPTLRFEHLSVDDGLAQESVLAVVQDADGFMWFGTQSGLSRYDGYRFTNFRNVVGDPKSLINNWVRVLYVDRKGRLWIGTDGGLDRYEPATGTFIHFQPDESAKRGNGNRHIRAILDDGKDGLWLATADGLQHFDIASGRFAIWHHVPGEPDSLASDKLTSLALDARGRLWIGSFSGLDSFGPDLMHFRHHPSPQGGNYDVIQALLVDKEQRLWVGSMGGLERLPLGQTGALHRFGADEGMPAGEISVLYQDAEHQIWVGSHDRGLYRWLPAAGKFAHHPHRITDSYSVGDNQVSALYADRVGTFWAGTWYGGVSRADLGSGGFARIVRGEDTPIALEDNKVRGIVADGAGKLWLATNGGLHKFDPVSGVDQAWRLEPVAAGVTGDAMATAVALGHDGSVWVGARKGLARLDPATGRMTRRRLALEVDANNVRNLLVTRDGVLWIATRGGLHRLDPGAGGGTLTTYQHDPASSASLADNVVRPLLEDSRGRLWVGTFDGLDLLDRATGKFRHFRHDPNDPSSLSHDEVHYLLEDHAGTLWVGTAVGLNKMVIGSDGTPRFQRYTRRDDMEDDVVAAMQEDLDGALWVSTSSGLSRLDPASGRWRNYNSADGTIEGAYFDASSLRGPDGTLYFGGNNGITAFNPRALHDNLIAPRAVITGLQIFDKPVQQAHPGLLAGPIERAAKLTLPASDSVFTLEFSALHFAAPGRNRFAYRLSGFDQDWINVDAGKRFATYTNLDPGTYLFEVRAANKDAVWGDAAASLEITILPPYWKTWWFRGLCALLVLGIGYGTYRIRLDGLSRRKDWLEHQVGVRTEKIEQQNRLLERQTHELREQQRQVRRRTDELAQVNAALQENEEGLYLAKQRAEDATRQKSEFLANMSHEMRTPLAGVIGMLGFALRDGQLKAVTREQILRGQANAQSLLAIINDLLDFSKIEAGKLTIENIDFALDDTINQVLTLFEEQAAAHSVGFVVHIDPDLPRYVVGDPTRLRQILVNLVGNAFKFTHSGTVTVRVECRPEEQWLHQQGRERPNMIRFSVEDTGIGIAADALPRLFQQFEQADATTTRRYGGTGLGLAICRQLVGLMGGRIGAVSTPGQGSTFSFLLPLADGVAPPLVTDAPRQPHTHRLRVLCAEDYPTNQIIVRMMLEELGHQVDVVDNGLLAVRACARTRYDLILMDGRMPEMDGASATRLIREGGSRDAPVLDQHMMIVALTANVSEEDRTRYLACGMDAFLTKPIDDTQLHFHLTRAIERQLQRGIPLTPMPELPVPAARPSTAAPSTADLDAMFGVATGPAPPTPPAPPARGAALRERMRSAFTADLPRRRAELDAALAAGDFDAAGRLLHGLRGSAGYLGEAGLQALCGELEGDADAGRLDAVRRRLPELMAVLARFEASTA